MQRAVTATGGFVILLPSQNAGPHVCVCVCVCVCAHVCGIIQPRDRCVHPCCDFLFQKDSLTKRLPYHRQCSHTEKQMKYHAYHTLSWLTPSRSAVSLLLRRPQSPDLTYPHIQAGSVIVTVWSLLSWITRSFAGKVHDSVAFTA